MLDHVLVSTDASPASDQLVECVKGLRRVGSQKAVLAHVLNVRDVGGLYQTLKTLVLPRLEAQQKSLAAAGFDVSLEIPLGYPAAEIARLAGERRCSLVVTGTHGESLAAEALLGSTAHEMLQTVQLPVLLIRMQIVEENGGRRCRVVCQELFRHILHPTDFSDVAERAFLYLEHIVRHTQSAVTLLHVQDRAKIDPHLKHRLEEFNRLDRERLERRRDALLQHGASAVDIEIPYGSPTGEILERARRGDCTLILMGTQGRGLLKEIFLGSVAHNVARRAPLPVLFVPAGPR